MHSLIKKFVSYWLPVTAWAGFIFYLSSIPSLESGLPGTWDWILRKGAHVSAYTALTVLIFRALHHGHLVKPKTAVLLAVVLALAYACSDEFHQRYVPGRHGRLRDVAVDTIGIATAGFVLRRKQN